MPRHVITTVGQVGELRPGSPLVQCLAEQVAATSVPGAQVAVDLYLGWPDLPEDPQEASDALARQLTGLDIAHAVRRVSIAVSPGDGRPVGYFIFRPQPDGTLEEDVLVRGVHPMVGRRLNLWRLRDFDLTRLDAPEDVLLTGPWPAATSPISGSSRWRRCVRSRWCATSRVGSSGCRTPSARSPTAWRRFDGPARRPAPAESAST